MKEPFAIGTEAGNVVPYSVFQQYANKADGAKLRALRTDPFLEFYDIHALVQPPTDLSVLSSLPLINTWHMRCVKTKASDTVGLGWGLIAKTDGASEKNKKLIEDFLKNNCYYATDMIGFDELLKRAHADRLSNGNLAIEFVYEDYDEDKPLSCLNYVPSSSIRVHKSGNKYCQMYGLKKVWFKRLGYDRDVDYATGNEYALGTLDVHRRASCLLHLKEHTSLSSFYGLPCIMPALEAIYSLISIRNYNKKFFENFGIPSYAIYITGDYDLGTKDPVTGEYKVISTIKAHLSTIQQHPHAPLILALPSQSPEGKVAVEFKPLSVEVKDGSFQVQSKDDITEVLVAHGMPPYRVGIAAEGSLGGSTAEESTEIYKQSVLQPDKTQYETITNRDIIVQGLMIEDWEFYLEELDLSDEDQDVKVGEFLFSKGGITPNELIKAFGDRFNLEVVEGVPGMDYHYINWVAVETGESISGGMLNSVKDFHGQLIELVKKGA